MFPDAESARIFLEDHRWGGHIVCPLCGCGGNITARKGKRLGYYRCRDCGDEFAVRTKTVACSPSQVALRHLSSRHGPQEYFIDAVVQGT